MQNCKKKNVYKTMNELVAVNSLRIALSEVWSISIPG